MYLPRRLPLVRSVQVAGIAIAAQLGGEGLVAACIDVQDLPRLSWPLAPGSWPLHPGSRPLAPGSRPLAPGSWRQRADLLPRVSWTCLDWPLRAGPWPLRAGPWPLRSSWTWLGCTRRDGSTGPWPLRPSCTRRDGSTRLPARRLKRRPRHGPIREVEQHAARHRVPPCHQQRRRHRSKLDGVRRRRWQHVRVEATGARSRVKVRHASAEGVRVTCDMHMHMHAHVHMPTCRHGNSHVDMSCKSMIVACHACVSVGVGVCVCVCACVCVCVCACVCACVYMCMYMYTYIRACAVTFTGDGKDPHPATPKQASK